MLLNVPHDPKRERVLGFRGLGFRVPRFGLGKNPRHDSAAYNYIQL